jgi:thioredoxin 1
MAGSAVGSKVSGASMYCTAGPHSSQWVASAQPSLPVHLCLIKPSAMNQPLRRLLLQTTLSLAAAWPAFGLAAAALPYNESADAQAELQAALQAAKTSQRPVLLIFGANWCEDCRALDAALKQPSNAPWMASEFITVKVDVGRFDKNLALANAYGNPIKKGIPAAVILSPDNQVVYATRAGELADARRMSETGIHDFFSQIVAQHPAR